ncbi:NAD(P)(+) transhydrogenase (Re/Si-specific) subunit beta [bacterium]|nr:NAD(P)(+) transhydrogenase (Re/Si-specific) subunit beta [bacterium]
MNSVLSVTLDVLFTAGFLWGIRLMNSPRTAVRGNLLGALSMFGAVVVTLISNGIVSNGVLWMSIAVGGIAGYVLAVKVAMIQMPQLVALLNGLGGGASAVTAFIVLTAFSEKDVSTLFTGALALAVGGVTFSGSMIAAAKLDRRIAQKPVVLKGHTFLNAATLVLTGMSLILVTFGPSGLSGAFAGIILVSALVFGLLFTVRIGGADMPVTISLLNSLSGLAGSIAGFAINNSLLVAVGAIVGSAGLILTRIMCRAMNRSLLDVILGKTTVQKESPGRDSHERRPAEISEPEIDGPVVKPDDYQAALSHLAEAKNIVIVPGYGMALSQAQEQVKKLFDKFQAQGKEVRFAIHPVAGRMPGHMNVLLAEVDIPYDRLYEMNDINPFFPETDVAVVVGANDVVNSAAITAENTPIYGMPILTVGEAKHVVICNIDTKPGYSGVDNPLYRQRNVIILLGDARETVGRLAEET